jgi:hypothetical protein
MARQGRGTDLSIRSSQSIAGAGKGNRAGHVTAGGTAARGALVLSLCARRRSRRSEVSGKAGAWAQGCGAGRKRTSPTEASHF